jgi:hypothetical protein
MRNWLNLFESSSVPDALLRAAAGDWPETLSGMEIFYMVVFIEALAIEEPATVIKNFEIYLEEEEGNENWSHLKNDSLVAHLQTVELGSFEACEHGCADPEVAKHYATLNTQAPPILIVNGSLQDGNHRVEAARQRGETHIRAYLVGTNPAQIGEGAGAAEDEGIAMKLRGSFDAPASKLDYDGATFDTYDLFLGDRRAGEITIQKGRKFATVRNVILNWSGEGMGKVIYRKLRSLYPKHVLRSSYSVNQHPNGHESQGLSQDAQNMWNSLVKRGEAIKTTDDDGRFYYVMNEGVGADPIDAAIKIVAKRHYGFSGNCGAFARALHRALGGGDFYAADSGDHYEYVDHIFLVYNRKAYDGGGRQRMKTLRSDYGPDVFEIDAEDTNRLVDSDGSFGGFNEARCEEDLKKALLHFGFKAKLTEMGRVVKGVNTTCDVGEDEIIRQAAKFGNKVDANGVPVHKLFEGKQHGGTFRVFHGTRERFKGFNDRFLGSSHGTAPINMTGFNFSDSLELARTFGEIVITADVTITNPLVINARGARYGTFKHRLNEFLDEKLSPEHDGVIIRNYRDCGAIGEHSVVSTHYVPRKVSQIKVTNVEGKTAGEREGAGSSLAESFHNAFNNDGRYVEIFRNPTKAEFTKLLVNGGARGFLDGETLYCWDGYLATHEDVDSNLTMWGQRCEWFSPTEMTLYWNWDMLETEPDDYPEDLDDFEDVKNWVNSLPCIVALGGFTVHKG